MNTQYVELCGRIFYQFVPAVFGCRRHQILQPLITAPLRAQGSRTNRETTFAQSEAKPQRLNDAGIF